MVSREKRTAAAVFVCCLLVLMLPRSASADLPQARRLDESGNTAEAYKYYTLWLAEQRQSPQFFTVLSRALDIAGSIEEEINLIKTHLYSVGDPSQRRILLKRLAVIEEITGDLSEAQIHYELASFVDPQNKDIASFLASAAILFELGETDRAAAQAQTLLRLSADPEVVFKAKLLLGRTYAAEGRYEDLNDILMELAESVSRCCHSSLSYFTLYHLARQAENSAVTDQMRRVLEEQFPESVEAALLSGNQEVALYPSPGLFLFPYDYSSDVVAIEETAEDTLVGIQTGSFTVKENAEYMIIDLRNAGFSPVMEEVERNETRYYKVLIPDIPHADSQNMMIRLKENGFEGFMVFP